MTAFFELLLPTTLVRKTDRFYQALEAWIRTQRIHVRVSQNPEDLQVVALIGMG